MRQWEVLWRRENVREGDLKCLGGWNIDQADREGNHEKVTSECTPDGNEEANPAEACGGAFWAEGRASADVRWEENACHVWTRRSEPGAQWTRGWVEAMQQRLCVGGCTDHMGPDNPSLQNWTSHHAQHVGGGRKGGRSASGTCMDETLSISTDIYWTPATWHA